MRSGWCSIGLALLACGCRTAEPPAAAKTLTGRTSSVEQFAEDKNVLIDVPYADKKPSYAYRLDLYLPAPVDAKLPQTKPPLLVYVHGGAWIGGDKGLYRFLGEKYRAKGVAVAVLNYRLSTTPRVIVPDHARDVADAVAYLAANREGRAYDPTRMVLMGHSAGAHTIALLAADSNLLTAAHVPAACLPKGYIGMEGIYDVPAIAKAHPDYVPWFLRGAFGSRSNWGKDSPSLLPIASKAPWLVVHSTGDTLVEIAQSTAFRAHLGKEGVPAKFLRLAGLSHDNVVSSAAEADSALFKAVLEMLQP